MSKKQRRILYILAAGAYILQFFTISPAQSLALHIAVDADRSEAAVSGRVLNDKRNRRNLSFLKSYAGISGIASRIFDVEAEGNSGRNVGVKRFIEGEYVADADMTGWRYKISLKPAAGGDAARGHVSWIDGDIGVLFLSDMLPMALGSTDRSATLMISLPVGWKLVTAGPVGADGSFVIADTDSSVLIISRHDAIRNLKDKSANISVSGTWQFTDSQAAEAADTIISDYARVFGSAPSAAQIALLRLPSRLANGAWEADTRGRSVTILAADTPFASQAIQRLHEQLRHEVFHLWFPEGVKLTDRYDWFFEGFALYESLKMGLRENRIGFQDMLDSLAAAYKLDSAQTTRRPLLVDSAERWSTGGSSVYSRGMLVAFLCDLAILRRSKGRRSVEDLLREIYVEAATRPGSDGNDVVLTAMRRRTELVSIVDRYVAGAEIVDWAPELRAAGIDDNGPPAPQRLTVSSRPGGQQRTILDKLGYNNWRKLSETSK